MTEALLIGFATACLGLLAWGVWRPGRVYQFPFLAGAVFAGFVLPGTVGLLWDGTVTPEMLNQLLTMSVLCASMCYLGHVCAGGATPRPGVPFDQGRLLAAAGMLACMGGAFYFLLTRLPDEIVGQSQWSGLPVAYLFFARLLHYGFGIALLLYARYGSRPALAVLLLAGVFFFDRIVIAGRRGTTVEVFLAVLCALWFGRRVALPRWAMAGALVAGTLFLHNTQAYREAVYQGRDYGTRLRHDEVGWSEILGIDFVGNFLTSFDRGATEMRSAAYHVAGRAEAGTFDWGATYWNDVVYQYVPAQLLGQEFKESLMFPTPARTHELAGYEDPLGTTSTGMADSFEAFGYTGCLVFFVIAFVLRRLYDAARAGQFIAQLAYLLILPNALHAVTHHTKWFFTPWVHMVVFLVPVFLWVGAARVVARGRRPAAAYGSRTPTVAFGSPLNGKL